MEKYTREFPEIPSSLKIGKALPLLSELECSKRRGGAELVRIGKMPTGRRKASSPTSREHSSGGTRHGTRAVSAVQVYQLAIGCDGSCRNLAVGHGRGWQVVGRNGME